MSWSYDAEALATSPRDVVRFMVGDTHTDRQLISDEEIDFTLTDNNGDIDRAASDIADAISAVFSSKADKTVGKLSISYGRQADAYSAMAKRLRSRSSALALPVAGGRGPTYLGGLRRDYDTSDGNVVPPLNDPNPLMLGHQGRIGSLSGPTDDGQ